MKKRKLLKKAQKPKPKLKHLKVARLPKAKTARPAKAAKQAKKVVKGKPKIVKPAPKLEAPKEKIPEKQEDLRYKNVDAIAILPILGYQVTEGIRNIINLLEKHQNLSENDIADKLVLKINSVRKLLYQLKEWGFADYDKQKDPEKTWWYIYFWSFNKKRVLEAYLRYLRIEIQKREVALKEEEEYAFICNKCNKKYTYTEGLERNFTCADCNGLLREVKNQQVIQELRKEIAYFKDKLDETRFI